MNAQPRSGDNVTDPHKVAERPETGKPIPFDRHPDGSKEKPFHRKDSETLSLCLAAMNLNMRYNLRSHRMEWRGLRLVDPDTWLPVTDRSLASIREGIARQYLVQTKEGPKPLSWGREPFSDTLNALVFDREIDPFEEWLEALPPWDGAKRLSSLLPCLFGAPADELSAWAGRYLFVGGVQRSYDPGCKLDQIPVLIGEQGIGKSAFARAAVPPEMPDLFSDGLRWDMFEQKQVEATLGRVVCEISEMAGRSKAEIEHVKSFISRQDDGHVRLVWHRSTEHLPRRFVLIGTTNNPNDLPNDPSGNRRFVPITLSHGCDVELYMDAIREQLWAEAMVAYHDHGLGAALPRSLHNAQRARAEEHRDRDDVIEDAVAGLPSAGRYTLSEIQANLGRAAEGMSQFRITRALKNAGWAQTRTMSGRFWERRMTHDTS